ncbi:MAG: hypothetical protein SF051_03425 [Elusimicrobiota bacterium]|nr:hypothetical protein [Elusimicrobiota bacterium]
MTVPRPFWLLLLAVPASASRVVAPRVRTVTAVSPLGSGMTTPSPRLTGTSPLAAPLGAPAPAFPRLPPAPSLIAAPAPADAPQPLVPGLPAVPMPNFIPQAARADAPLEDQTGAGRAMFDLGAPAGGEVSATPRLAAGPTRPELGPGWSLGSFTGEGGQSVAYKRRAGTDRSAPARVFSGGLALNESFDTLFAGRAAARDEYFLWTRAHAPTGWTPTRSPLDADALDLARMLVTAARGGSGKTELVLHSFGTLVFQRMLQLRGEPLVDEALASLAGQRVVFLHGTTRYEGSERRAGREFEQMGQATRAFTDWLNTADDMVSLWEKTARLNPLLGPAVEMWLAQWRVQREQVLSMASRDAVAMMRKDLSEPWAPELEPARRRFQQALERDARDPGWQEALLRRSGDMFRLAMTPADVKHLRKLGVTVEMVHARGDALLNWETARALYDLYGVKSPAEAPPAGTVLEGRGARAIIVDGDHYWPLKRPGELARLLDR